LDPDISFEGAIFQIERVAKARKIQEAELRALICHLEEPTFLGLFPRRVNVLKLNTELDRLRPQKTETEVMDDRPSPPKAM